MIFRNVTSRAESSRAAARPHRFHSARHRAGSRRRPLPWPPPGPIGGSTWPHRWLPRPPASACNAWPSSHGTGSGPGPCCTTRAAVDRRAARRAGPPGGRRPAGGGPEPGRAGRGLHGQLPRGQHHLPAIWRTGAVATPVLFLLSEDELRHVLGDSGAALVVTTPEFLPKVMAAAADLPSVRGIVVVGEPMTERAAPAGRRCCRSPSWRRPRRPGWSTPIRPGWRPCSTPAARPGVPRA